MNTLITIGVVLVIALIVTLVIVRITRTPGGESPKRRELRRANVRAIRAERAMLNIEGVIKRYRPVLDDVEAALVHDLDECIETYKQKTLESDQ